MSNQIYLDNYKEFCDLFAGLSISQAKELADKMELSYIYDNHTIDINFKNICATIKYDELKGIYVISDSYECWTDSEISVSSKI